MRSVLRNIAAVVVGFIAASIVMMVVEFINGHVLYPRLGQAAAGLKDRASIQALFASAPIGSFIVVIIGWALGSFAGGWVTAKLSKAITTRPILILGILLTLAGFSNNLMLAPPLWFWIISLLVFIPAAYAGARLSGRSREAQ
jgi:hypothetical protein